MALLRQLLFVCAVWQAGSGQTVPKPAMRAPASGDAAIARIAKEADAAREANRMPDAIALYRKGVAIKPYWEEGWWYLGTLYYDLDD